MFVVVDSWWYRQLVVTIYFMTSAAALLSCMTTVEVGSNYTFTVLTGDNKLSSASV